MERARHALGSARRRWFEIEVQARNWKPERDLESHASSFVQQPTAAGRPSIATVYHRQRHEVCDCVAITCSDRDLGARIVVRDQQRGSQRQRRTDLNQKLSRALRREWQAGTEIAAVEKLQGVVRIAPLDAVVVDFVHDLAVLLLRESRGGGRDVGVALP